MSSVDELLFRDMAFLTAATVLGEQIAKKSARYRTETVTFVWLLIVVTSSL